MDLIEYKGYYDMSSKLTQHDLDYIEFVKNSLESVEAWVVHFPADNPKTFTWTEKEFLVDFSNLLKPKMIEAFIHDLTHGTKTYEYTLYNHTIPHIQAIVDKFLDNTHLSQHLKLTMLDLFEDRTKLYEHMLNVAYEQKDLDFMLILLQKGAKYPHYRKEPDYNLISDITSYYKKLQSMDIDNKLLQENFISHIKNSFINLSEADLIHWYLDIFSEQNMSNFYQAFNIEEKKVCIDIQENAYSKITLNLSALATIKLGSGEINDMARQLLNYPEVFPNFFTLNSTKTHINLLVEINTQFKHSEKKVAKLFEEMVAQRYDFNQDKEQEFKALLILVKSIDEMIDLDAELSSEKSTKLSKTMLKI